MSARKPASPALLALTASALAVLAPRAHAQQPDSTAPQAGYRYSAYREAAIPADKTTAADGSRYDIDSHQFRLVEEVGSTLTLVADATFETMSGASPWFVQAGPGGKPLQVMSRASIQERRAALDLALTRAQDKDTGTLRLGYSNEEDYQSLNGGLSFDKALADTVTTLSAGVNYSYDTLDPRQGTTATSTVHDTRSALGGFVGYARVLDAVTQVQTSLSYTLHDGFLSDPYKAASISGVQQFDQRPNRRNQYTWLTRLRHYFKGTNGAVHADYRFYGDDWKVTAHTVDLSYVQRVTPTFRVSPGVRWYSQSQAYFYEVYYPAARSDNLASSDYRLSPYGALSLNLSAAVDVAGWGLDLRYEHYDSGAKYAAGKVAVENPGLVDFQVVSLGLKKAF